MVPNEPGASPRRVQIQTQSGCNGRCVFCPNEDVLRSGLAQGRMSPALFHKIIDELAASPPSRVSLYLMNEPLLDLRLPEFVRYVAERIPASTTLVTSNGTQLTEDMGAALIDAGLKRLKVSVQSLDPETNRELMGPWCDSEKVVGNVLAFKRLLKEKRSKLDLRVSMLVTKLNQDEIEDTRRFWRGHGIRLVTSALENRGGNIEAAEDLNPHEMACYHCSCVRPSREMCILWNGDVVLCCVDWWRTVIVGNVEKQSIGEVWKGEDLEVIRSALRENNEILMPTICSECTESAQPDFHRAGFRGFLSRRYGFSWSRRGDSHHE